MNGKKKLREQKTNMNYKVDKIPDFTFDNAKGNFIPIIEAIIIVARVVNKLVVQHNNLAKEFNELKGKK